MKSAVPLLAFFAGVLPAADVKVVELIVAKVNNEIITRGEIEHSRRQLEIELKRQGLTEPDSPRPSPRPKKTCCAIVSIISCWFRKART